MIRVAVLYLALGSAALAADTVTLTREELQAIVSLSLAQAQAAGAMAKVNEAFAPPQPASARPQSPVEVKPDP